MKSKWIKIGSLFIALVLSISALYIYIQSAAKNSALAESTSEITLTRPPFLTDAAATYLEQEAGIAYYVNTTETLNLNTAKNALDFVENITSDYVIGVLGPKVYPESDDYSHCFVHKDGWIVVYYLKLTAKNNACTGKIINWNNRTQIHYPIAYNLLYIGLDYIARETFGISLSNAKYYHFQHPTATKLLFAIKKAGNGQTATFNIYLPDDINERMSERSWSCYRSSGTYTFKIDANTIFSGSGWNYGTIDETILGPGSHTISISASSITFGDYAYVCLILLYR